VAVSCTPVRKYIKLKCQHLRAEGLEATHRRARRPEHPISFMLDPSEYVFSETFWDGTTVNKTGREATVAGRECVEVRAETVSWGYPPYVFARLEREAST
jgi:hypothetical protein